MAYYEWSCCVEGKDNGVVKANSVKNALKKAKKATIRNYRKALSKPIS